MKLLPYSFLALICFMSSCSDEKEGDLSPDCTETDLSLEIVETTNAHCEIPGGVGLHASGGQGDYIYSLDGNNFQSAPSFESLSAGGYIFYVKDKAGCIVSISGNVSTENGSVVGSVVSIKPSGCGSNAGEVTLNASGGDSNYQFRVDEGDFASAVTIRGLEAGSHTFTVKDGAGCSDDGTFDILSGASLVDEVMPIITTHCAVTGCHGSSQQPVLNTRSAVMANANRIRIRTTAETMPPAGRTDLTQEQIDLIACWANDGAPDN